MDNFWIVFQVFEDKNIAKFNKINLKEYTAGVGGGEFSRIYIPLFKDSDGWGWGWGWDALGGGWDDNGWIAWRMYSWDITPFIRQQRYR